MSTNDESAMSPGYRSLTGQMETQEPAGSTSPGSSTITPTTSQSQLSSQSTTSGSRNKVSEGQQRQAPTSTTSSVPPRLRKSPSASLVPVSLGSTNSSPQTSRNTSPIRKDSRPQTLTGPISGQPSAAAIQRVLSATSVPQLQQAGSGPVSEAVSRLPRTAKSTSGSGMNTPDWPVSPRLKSPPPSGMSSRKGSAATFKKAESSNAPPSIKVEDASPQLATPSKVSSDEQRRTDPQLQAPPKVSSRGPSGKSMLETVQETSSDSIHESPAATQASAELKPLTKIAQEDSPATKKEGAEPDKHAQYGESGSESAGSKVDRRRGRSSSLSNQSKGAAHQQKPSATKSYTPLASVKSRATESKQNMTVETETVASIPQSALNPGDRIGSGRVDPSGTVRLKPSTETIRPKKERKKPSQKARSINQGTGMYSAPIRSPLLVQKDSFEHTPSERSFLSESYNSSTSTITEDVEQTPRQRSQSYWPRAFTISRPSKYIRTMSDKWLRKASSKADIFEARVANTMDEANTSDSDETFVYESNPPEQARRPRHHSRTPSVTSSHSLADQRPGGVRGLEIMMDERRVAGKRSMKFSNTAYNEDSPDSKSGTIRSAHARHYGKFGRGGSQGGMYDPESPFTQASKLRNTHSSLRQSRPNSPKSPQNAQQNRPSGLFSRKEQSFDLGGEGADDERTPLVGTVRTPRTPRHARRLHTADGSVRSIDEYYGARDRAWCTRFSGCLLGSLIVMLVVMSAVGFLVMSNRPMYDVKIKKIQNVLASEQELMLDLLVGATNPNALGITITELDVNMFAKSKHAGSGLNPDVTSSMSLLGRRRAPRLQRTKGPEAQDEGPHLPQDLSAHWRAPAASGGDRDDGTDPSNDGDLDSDAHTMLLGRIFHFDQALTFEGSPLKRHEHYSVGELRLMHPGNKTETGGTARWERILQHPFELIVRGVLKYDMPVSCRPVSVGVGASVEVHPEDGVDDMGRMRIAPIKHEEHWQWIDWDAIKDALDREKETGE